ncbi:MAG: RNA pseudouridine synthase, partial [Gammaproteobacteria bacterium]|nr:RNA pseudouridine synthase [Gammaproteobacteria bacterium]
LKFPRGASEALKAGLRDFQRQALHAGRLGLIHPATGKQVYWKVKLPEDMKNLLALMEEDLAEMESDDFD